MGVGESLNRDQPGDDSWAELREAQFLTAKSVAHSGLAVTVDTGDADNIHPPDKNIVGERLAFCALAKDYGKDLPFAGPTFASADHLPGALNVNTGSGISSLMVTGISARSF